MPAGTRLGQDDEICSGPRPMGLPKVCSNEGGTFRERGNLRRKDRQHRARKAA